MFDSINGLKTLRTEISFIFQNFGLIEDFTVYENLIVATKYLKIKKYERNIMVKEALESGGMTKQMYSKIYELSGGEQQRISIAKCLLKPSNVILAEEPTGSLDYENSDLIMKMLVELNKKGKTIIVVTHDPKVELCAARKININSLH